MPPHELPNLLRLKAEKGTNRRGQAEKFCQVDPVGSGGKLEVAAERTLVPEEQERVSGASDQVPEATRGR